MVKIDLHSLWQKGQKKITENQKLSKMEIEAYIKPRVNKTSRSVKFNIYFYTILAFACVVMLIINCVYYISNPIILTVNAIGILMSSYIVYYGWYSYVQFKGIETGNHDLSSELLKKIDFYYRIYERWMWFIPTITIILIFALNTMVDNQNGTYRINRPWLYAGINLVIYVGIYLLNKVSHTIWLGDIKKYLNDLENQIIESSLKIESRKKKYAWLLVLILMILAAFFVWGIIKVK